MTTYIHTCIHTSETKICNLQYFSESLVGKSGHIYKIKCNKCLKYIHTRNSTISIYTTHTPSPYTHTHIHTLSLSLTHTHTRAHTHTHTHTHSSTHIWHLQ